MSFSDNVSKFRLPLHASMEELECNLSKVIRFNDSIIVAGYYFMGRGKPSYFAAIYDCTEEDFTCESVLEYAWVSDVQFEDDGHAILAAIEAMTLPAPEFLRKMRKMAR